MLSFAFAGVVNTNVDVAKKVKLAKSKITVKVGQTKTVKIKNIKKKRVKKLTVKTSKLDYEYNAELNKFV